MSDLESKMEHATKNIEQITKEVGL